MVFERRPRGRVTPDMMLLMRMSAPPRSRSLFLAAAVALALVLAAVVLVRGLYRPVAEALRTGARSVSGELPDVPVIEEGRGATVQRLFRGHPLGSYPAPGWRFMEISLQPRSINVRVDGPTGHSVQMILRHPDDAAHPSGRSASFALLRTPGGDPDGERSLDVLAAELSRNDDGHFWQTRSVVLTNGEESGRVVNGIARWLLDGALLLALLLALLGLLLWRSLRDEPRAVRLALAGGVVAGALYRLTISAATTMDVWPYSRLLALPRLLFTGPTLAALSRHFDLRIYLSDLILTYTLVAGLLAPAALFAHAKALLQNTRSALWASAIIAVLPAHVRFSHSDTGFIPSAVFASMTFALISQALRDPSRTWRIVALCATPWLMLITMEQRALNAMFPALYFAQIWLLQPAEVPRLRRVLTSAVVTLAALVFAWSGFLEKNHSLIGEVLGPRTLLNAARGLPRPGFNTLIHFGITPPLLLALALLGIGALWRSDRRRLAAFLVAWLALFFIANAVIVPSSVEMQSRYHLHLAAPFALAAGWGAYVLIGALAARWPRPGTPWFTAAIGVCLACLPLLYRGYERRTDFNDLREYDFVRSVRSRIPRGCTVLEHHAASAIHDLRFGRMGRVLDRGELRNEFRALPVTAPRPARAGDQTDPLVAGARAVFADPPECLMFFRGLPCAGAKEPGEATAPACTAVMAAAPMDLVARTRFISRPYDENVSQGVMHQRVDIEIGLYSVRVDALRERHHGPARD